MAHTYPRGIAPELLLSQVRNTMPYLFEQGIGPFPPALRMRAFDGQLSQDPTQELTHPEYFKLCVSAHYLTCATPVPTDVDNQIRLKLWPKGLPLELALEMARFVIESRGWDFTQVTGRYTFGAQGSQREKGPLSGHLGEWFTVAAGAYCAMRRYRDETAKTMCETLLSEISDEVTRHSEIFGSLWRAQDGLGCLKASASIAHNLGDLDRVMDMWELEVHDPLRMQFYKLGTAPFDHNRKLRYLGRLWVAGELYKSPIGGSSMALENHRHFALRKPRCLRESPAFLIPTGPFFDAWGKTVATHLPPERLPEVIEALLHGWERLPKTVGYERALIGICGLHPKLRPERKLSALNQEGFEKSWSKAALHWMDEIPSRAE